MISVNRLTLKLFVFAFLNGVKTIKDLAGCFFSKYTFWSCLETRFRINSSLTYRPKTSRTINMEALGRETKSTDYGMGFCSKSVKFEAPAYNFFYHLGSVGSPNT